MAVPSLGKQRLERCRHVGDGGCAIYATRPEECATFGCRWFATPDMPEGMRPDQSGILVWSEPAPFGQASAKDGMAYLTWAQETRPDGLESYWAQKMLKQLSRRLLIFGIRFGQLRMEPDSAHVFGPPHIVAEAARFRREGRRGVIR